jgi:hypothetical protein
MIPIKRRYGGRLMMARIGRGGLGILILAMTAAAASAGELPGPAGGLGALSAECYRQPGEVRIGVARERRALAGRTDLDAFRRHWELAELGRDAGRVERARRRDHAPPAGGELLRAERALSPLPRGLRGDPVIGTGKAWVRLGGLLVGAERSLDRGDRRAARGLHAAASRLHATLAASAPDDVQAVVASARLATLAAALAAGG